MTDHDIALLYTIIDCALNGVWLGSFLTYILMTMEDNPHPRVQLVFWIIGIILCYPFMLGVILDSIMAIWALYDIYKIDRLELEEMLAEIRRK